MTHLAEIRPNSKALQHYFHPLPVVAPERQALVWLTSRFRFSSPELAATVAELAFSRGGRQ
jgi:hypothetical protein